MTGTHSTDDGRTAPRLMTDGGTRTLTRTVNAKDVVTREIDGDDVDMLRVPISSTRTDREGDRFAREALDGMAEQIREDQPMVFDNHGLAGSWMDAIPYDSRETIGAQMDAEVVDADDGEAELYAYVNPDGTHPEGERMIRQVRDEAQPIKFSVGFRILNSDPIEDNAGNEIGREFTDVDEMETSRVGIPANPDASASQDVAAKSGGSAEGLPGYQNHPVMRMMEAMGGDAPAGDVAAKSVAPDGGKDEGCGCGSKEEGDPCDDNGDCGEGMVCVDGECVPEDDDEDEEESADPDAVRGALEVLAAETDTDPDALRESVGLVEGDDAKTMPDDVREELAERRQAEKELREEIAELRSGGLERGDADTGDTTINADAPEVDDTDDTDADESNDNQKADTRPATEIARDY